MATNWVPNTDFEKEVVAQQPDYNFIYGNLTDSEPNVFYPRPKSHLEYAAAQKKLPKEQKNLNANQNHKLNVISQVQRITGIKKLGEQPTVDDWNDDENIVEEAVAMMRHFGLGPSIEVPLDEKITIATHPIPNKVSIMKNGKKTRPILFDEDFFKLKPRVILDNEEERTEEPISSTSTPIAEDYNNSSTSFSSSNSCAVTPQQNKSWRSNISSKSSDDFVTANDEASFYTASNTSNGYVATRSWYKSGSRNDGRNMNRFNNCSSSDGVSGSSGTTSASSSYKNEQKRLSKQLQEEKQGPRFYTAKELYEKKRNNF